MTEPSTNGGGSDPVALVSEYLQLGGLFNPELMEHNKVRDMVIALRDAVVALRAKVSRSDDEYVAGQDSAYRLGYVQAEGAATRDLTALREALAAEKRRGDSFAEALRAAAEFVGGKLGPECTDMFHRMVPAEVGLVVKKLTTQRDQARQDLERVGRERAEARAKPDADLLQSWADRMAAGVLLACDCGMLDQRSAAADALLCWAALRFDCVAHEALGKLRDLSAAWSKYP